MIHRVVQFALQQRFVVLMFTVLIIIAGAESFRRMPVDAYPDLSPPMVELVTQWPGHAAEEVERLTTLPLELAMNGTPHLQVMRSISLYGLSALRPFRGFAPSRSTDCPTSASPSMKVSIPTSPGNWFSNALATPLFPRASPPACRRSSVRAASSIVTSSKVQTVLRRNSTPWRTGSSNALIAACPA